MAKKDCYNVLGVQQDASDKEIKQAYRRLARQYHPDVNPGDATAEQKFKEISEAYSVVGTPENRKKYDRFGHQAFSGGFDPSAGGSFGGFDPRGFKDFFGGGENMRSGGFGEGLGSIFEDFIGGRPRSQRAPAHGKDREQTVEISFEEAIRGTTRQIPTSDTQGRAGRSEVKIPPGVDTGLKMRLTGKGAPGVHGGAAGDLYIHIRVRPHDYFRRDSNDITCEVPVTLAEAMLGAKIDVPTIDGLTTMTLPPGTQNGRRFRLRGKGVPRPSGGERGDQYVTVRVVLPEKLDARSKALVEELTALNPLQPRAHMRG